jgi:hypothetical protein
MKFTAGERHKQIEYIVERRRKELEHGEWVYKRGLSAKFFDHKFDSEKAQKALGWTDEERIKVENHLLNDKDFRTAEKGRRLRVDGAYLREGEAFEISERCDAKLVTPNGPEPCPLSPVPGFNFCKRHILERVDSND